MRYRRAGKKAKGEVPELCPLTGWSRGHARRALRQNIGQFDLVFADPPYATPADEIEALLREIAGQGALSPGARIILTRARRNDTIVIPVQWREERRLSYGDSVVLVLRAD